MYGFTPGAVPESYEPISWQEKRERIPSDFGEPHKTNPADWNSFEDVERSDDYQNWTTF